MNQSRRQAQERIDAAIDRAIGEQRIVGAVVIVFKHGERIYQRAAGWADREAWKPMARDTIFRYASLAKPLVTVAARRLAEQEETRTRQQGDTVSTRLHSEAA